VRGRSELRAGSIHSLPHGENEEIHMSITQQKAASFSTFDIANRVNEVFAENGFAATDDDGNILRLKEKVIERIADVLIRRGVAATNDERIAKAVTKVDLYEETFPEGPRNDDPDEIESAVAENIATYVWSTTTPSYDGRVQRELGNRPDTTDVMLCRRKIGGMPSVYITRTDDLIVDDFIVPASERIVKVADKTRRDMGLVIQRRPSLEARVKAELEGMAVKASVALGVTKSAKALKSGK
jgi:hypothetical protein